MSITEKFLSYCLLAFVTLGITSVPHAIYYEHPRLIYAHYMREELK